MPTSPPPASWPTPAVSSYCSSGGCPPAAVAANLSAISAFSTLAYYVERDGSLQTCGPTYPACTWDVGDVDKFNAQTAHDTGAAPQPLVFSNSGDMVAAFRALAKTPASIAAAAQFLAVRAARYGYARVQLDLEPSCWDANASACEWPTITDARAYAGFVDAAAAALDAANGATVSVAAGSYPGSQCLPAEYEQCTAAGDDYEAQCVSGAWDVSTCNCCAYITWFALEPLCGTRAAAIINMDTYQQAPVNYSAFDGAVAWYEESACAGRVAIGLLAGEVADEDDAARVVRAAAAAASAGEIDIWANLWGASTREAWAPALRAFLKREAVPEAAVAAAADDDVRWASAPARRPLRRYGGAVRAAA